MICEACGNLSEDCECDKNDRDAPIIDESDDGNWIHDPDMGDQ